VTVPETDEAARATLGHTTAATNTAAGRNPYTRPRMLGSLDLSGFIV
jgi:hypothetical protein